LTASGLSTDEFHFIGFLPHKSGQRRRQLQGTKEIAGTLVLYESPYRIEKLLSELQELFPERKVVLARELTKKFEEYLAGTPSELVELVKKRHLKGEFVVLVAAPDDAKP
jgi:16S rRNA (cytidine1402-2'-O)-methyltransferase